MIGIGGVRTNIAIDLEAGATIVLGHASHCKVPNRETNAVIAANIRSWEMQPHKALE
jgi:hypothetical protein